MQRISLVDNSCDILPLHGDETCHFVTDGAEPRVRSRGKSDEREREMSFEELPYFMADEGVLLPGSGRGFTRQKRFGDSRVYCVCVDNAALEAMYVWKCDSRKGFRAFFSPKMK